MRFFLAGIMQGSHRDTQLHDQRYRQQLAEAIGEAFPDSQVYDPLADHQDSVSYDDGKGREVFFHHNRMCREVDVVLAFLPEASMGTAIEMWEAYRHDRVVVAISPLVHNWAVKFLSHKIYVDIESFLVAIRDGELAKVITEK